MRVRIFWLVFVWLQLAVCVHGAIPVAERDGLMALYNRTDGAHWTQNTGWKTPPLHTDGFALPGTEQNWFGVTVLNGHVTELHLNSNHLGGNIPSEVSNLPYLQDLHLEQNQLTGSIPTQLGSLGFLKFLFLKNNQLTGSIPPQLGNLSHMIFFSLEHNQLSGSIPMELGNFNDLQTLSLNNNQLTGSIPPQLGNLQRLEFLDLATNKLTGPIPSQLGNLGNLQQLVLRYNQLTGSIPSQLGNLGNVYYLALDHNQLSGSIPVPLGLLGNLQYLFLGSNQLTGHILLELGNLENLKSLDLGQNQLTGHILLELGNLGNLKSLDLGYNQLTGGIPIQLGNLENLLFLSLAHNQLTGGIPPQLGNLGNLQYLYLYDNPLTGGIPPELGHLGNLIYLFLYNTQLGGTIPRELGNLGNLQYLNMYENQLSGSIPRELGQLSHLKSLYLYANRLSGNIPPELGNLGNLQSLYLNTNQLTGSIPSQLGNLGNLRTLNLKFNQLTGNIPPQLGDLNKLQDLYLGINQLDGEIPATLTHLQLFSLDISYNCLFATDVTLRTWLARKEPAWESHQGHCSGSFPTMIAPPFGSFDGPIDGSTVSGSVPVTGWALDDCAVASVKIYRPEGYIGDAVFVAGARPDVALAYSEFPGSGSAGWGYMLLTNFLPDGQTTLTAMATDVFGETTELGTRTIMIDNAHAVKPFGAIDSPRQGGTVLDSPYRNNGWVLTPKPNKIPTNGSTIIVYMDGKPQGFATYNLYRADIAQLFPGYANSNNAWGYFDIDTMKYASGLHTISWEVTDDAGNRDGIGSRYFTIWSNPFDTQHRAETATQKIHGADIAPLPENVSDPVYFHKGFGAADEYQELVRDEKGNRQLTINELEPVEIQVGQNYMDIQGYVFGGNQVDSLPIGSTLDIPSGVFYWSPGPGFIGRYPLVFVLTDATGLSVKKSININIEPKFSGNQ